MADYTKDTKFTKNVFKMCDVIAQPLSNWGRQSTKGLVVINDVPYGEGKDNVGDIFFKQELADVKKPVVLQIHGGGFVGGDKAVRNAISIWYANIGYFVYNINYGVAPEFRFPVGTVDAINAFNFLVDNAEKYNLDLDKIVIGGDSTGGYMTSAVATASYDKDLQEFYGVAPKVKPHAVILNCGVYDIEPVLKNKAIFDIPSKIALDLLGVDISELEKYEHKKFLSSYDFVTEEFPKTYMMFAKNDIFVPGQGERLLEKLQNLGVYVESYCGTRATDNHVFPLFWDFKSAKEANAGLKVFLEKVRDGEI